MNIKNINENIQKRCDQMVSKGLAKHADEKSHRAYLQRQSKAFNESLVKSKIQKLTLEANAPDFETYLHVYSDLPVSAIDELMNIVKSNPSVWAFDNFCSKWNLL